MRDKNEKPYNQRSGTSRYRWGDKNKEEGKFYKIDWTEHRCQGRRSQQ